MMNYFEKVYCINLDSREDRWNQAQEEFKRNNIVAERVSAVEGAKLNLDFPPEIKEGAVGCSLSHLFIMKMAKQLNLESYLVLEDDVKFIDNFTEIFPQIMSQVPDDWDMLYLGGQHIHGRNIQEITPNIYKCEYTLTTHSFAVRNTVYDLFIDKLIDITKPCDVHFAEQHKKINAYVCIPHLTWQREGYSDVEGQSVNYEFLKYHRYI